MEPRLLEVTRTPVPLPGLHPDLDRFSIAFITDIHHGTFVPAGWIAEVVRRTNAQSPDAVVLGGDYVLGGTEYIEPCMEELAAIEAPTYAVLGNHDHWEDAGLTAHHLEATAGATLLRNAGAWLGRGGARVRLWGVGDLWEDVQSLEGIRPDGWSGPTVLATHNPDYAEELPEGVADLVLAGHTHGGQIVLPLVGALKLPSYYGQKYRSGVVRKGGTIVYVSRGVGTGSPPVRLNCRPELALMELVPERRTAEAT